jgi:hypothetical protein
MDLPTPLKIISQRIDGYALESTKLESLALIQL